MSYSREEVKAVTDKVLNMCKADAVEVEFAGGERSATRYANSSITANLVENDQEIQITVYYGKKTATATTHQFDDASLKRTIEAVQALAQRKPENPEVMPLVKPPQQYIEVDAALPSAVNFGPAERAQMVKVSTDICEKKGVLGAGYIPKFDWVNAAANSEGLFTYFHYADASFILTCRTPDQTGSGWAGTTGVKDIANIDAAMLTEVAADKALKSAKPRAIEPGNYTVILEPRPAARYLSLMLNSLNARAAEEGCSFAEQEDVRRDAARREGLRRQLHAAERHRQQRVPAVAHRAGRLTARPVTWVEKGVVKNLYYDRFWAQRQKKDPTGTAPNMSLVMEGARRRWRR
ncbi:MAG: metallopeptidase TldD-related protein [Vicinamibacterales bacterium]